MDLASAARALTGEGGACRGREAGRADLASPKQPDTLPRSLVGENRERMADDKRITGGQHGGGLGESVAAVFIKKLGHEFHETGRNEAGIDGFIELRELPSGRVRAQVIACQVKSGTSDISDETDEGFTWTASEGDLSYWENSNLPVIVIIVRTDPDEAWWRAVDEAFPDEAA